jgi:hypothetical protein
MIVGTAIKILVQTRKGFYLDGFADGVGLKSKIAKAMQDHDATVL